MPGAYNFEPLANHGGSPGDRYAHPLIDDKLPPLSKTNSDAEAVPTNAREYVVSEPPYGIVIV